MRPRLRIPLRSRVSAPSQSTLLPLACRTRSLHSLVPLEYDLQGGATEKGIADFLSPAAFNIAWNQYQTHLLARLNALVADYPEFQSRHVKDIMLRTAREPSMATIFNHASMIHNNHFFFKHLSPNSVAIPETLRSHLENSFGSIETLRREMVYTAVNMFGPGFVWLVKTAQPGLPVAFKVLATYAAGSPYPGAHWRRQSVDMNTLSQPVHREADSGAAQASALEAGKAYLDAAAFGAGKKDTATAKKVEHAPGGTDLLPVLCINTWEHVWLWDYGFGVGGQGGKLGYAEKWWKQINWELVLKEANIQRHQMSAGTGAPAAAEAAA
ncbi:putative 37S ribosomal protein [Parathielavia appendiculata]|uniref:37S ribosomal protein n=1 Tax=Parathielavia appendiculata TaxID=2587402 RepID=A0AAN6U9P4_9PEZI|nr:putative 37S ribosomal protein [Parathielavia appendiculata]